jgi:Uncharacterized homolog of the cytoplasmic domain of flagellar protein FhlB
MTFSHECIVCIVNTGFSDAVMDAAREFGARGGTVIHGRGTVSREAERFFGISIQPDKELVLILVPHDLSDEILHALYRAVGLKTPGQGIAFSLPVDQVVGLSSPSAEEETKGSDAL